ncbi:MAG: S8 family serine peptidase [Euryarchaeota archaeon]|nr:S8 family serine peptidase [Euryarchaeota archaeon]
MYGPEIPDAAIEQVRLKFHTIKSEGFTLDGDYLFQGTLQSSTLINEVATNPYVDYIFPIPKGHPMDEAAIQIVGGGLWVDDNDADYDTPYRTSPFGSRFNQVTGCTGQGITIGIADSGLGNGTVGDAGHPDFGNRIIGGMSYAGGGWDDVTGHGTHCAGLIAANGFSGTGVTYNGFGPYYAGMGLAYDANLYIQKFVVSIPPSDVGIILRDAEAAGVRIHSNSWGDNEGGNYSDWDQAYDARTRDADPNVPMNQQILAIVAAGNEGPNWTTIGSPGNAKNVITVGGTENYMPDSLSFGNTNPKNTFNPDALDVHSSRGWTQDGRIKPDIVAPGENILSTRSPNAPINSLYGTYTADNRYEWASGTSMATPIVAGGAAVVYNWYQNEDHGMNPSPAMIKALLINSAKPLGDIPNRDEGWGRMYLTPFADHSDLFYVVDQDNVLGALTIGQYHEYELVYADNTQPFKVTLVWTDPAALLGANPALVNDLNLLVTTPGGSVYRGNVFSGGWSSMGGTHDFLNNVECIYIPPNSLVPGKYTIRVSGDLITTDCDNNGAVDQDYALVVYNGAVDNTPPDSKVSQSAPYWRTTSPIPITATASDAVSGVKEVSLHYRYRPNTGTDWPNDWTFFGTDTDGADEWSWSFPWKYGDNNDVQGCYQFRTIATDNAGNVEAAPAGADAGYGYDATAPPAPGNPTPTGTLTVAGSPTSVAFQWNTVTDLSGITRYQLQVDGINYYPTTNIYSVSLSHGSHTWKVRAEMDNANNYGAWSPLNSLQINIAQTYGTVSGYVQSVMNSQGIPGATVDYYYTPVNEPNPNPTILSSGGGYSISAITNSAGYYTMYNVPVGYHNFQASATGYHSSIASNVYVPATGLYLCFNLQPISSGGGGGGGGGGCLVPGTKISTPNGEVNIEDIREGDTVLSYNVYRGIMEPDIVYRTLVHSITDEYLLINDRLGLTANHLIYVGNDVKRADELQQGDILLSLEGNILVSSITRVSAQTVTYNIEVESNSNYFAEGILVHNVCKLPQGGCPFVYTWDGDSYEEENNILPLATKPDRNQLDVDDYYLLQNDLQPINDLYSLQIFEPALERTHLDDVQLAIIDHNYSNVQLAITPDGVVKTIIEPQGPVSCIDSTGSNVSELVDEMNDGYRLKAEHNETLTVYFPRFLFFNEAKLVISHKATIDLLPYDVPLDPRYYKCSIHVQTMNENGRWSDFALFPARMNWVLDCVDITPLSEKLNNGEPIRLLITGTHFIDFIGLDISDSLDLDIELVKPNYVAFIDDVEGFNFTELLLQRDQQYLTISPNQGIELVFPYKEQTAQYRAFAFIPHGHYYNLPEIAIVQPVTVNIAIPTEIVEGTLNLFLEEITATSESMVLQGVSIDLSSYLQEDFMLMFNQDPLMNYQLHAWVDNCTQSFRLPVTFTSFRSSKTLNLMLSPSNQNTQPLADILWNVTGARFNCFSGQYEVLKNTVIQYDLNEYYHYEISESGSYEWIFGDGFWTNDARPTHVYEQPGIYPLNLTIFNVTEGGMFFFTSLNIKVVQSPPVPVISIYQEVGLTLTIAGRKDNTVGIRIYEDGALIQSYDVVRTAGPPNSITIGLNKYLDRAYEIELVYLAEHKGANPTWLTFTSGETTLTYFKEFNTQDGYSQTIPVPISYLDDAVENNPSFVFDASDSYDIDGEIVSYEWDFGDGNITQGIMAEHTYSALGLYEVTLTVTDDDGIASVKTAVIVCVTPVSIQPPPPRFTPRP